MKLCGYCGGENHDEATACRGCGTTEFRPAISAASADAANKFVRTEADDPVELQRCRDPESLTQIGQILDAAGIAYQRSSLPPMFDIGKIGAGDDTPVIVSVPRNLYAAARAAMESAFLKTSLPQDHYLLTSTDEELAEIVGQSSEWSAFDVAHARRLIGERGIDSKKVKNQRAQQICRLERGRPAPKLLILFGWVFSVLGGAIGFGIAWSLSYMKEKTPHGDFFTYDEESRAVGRKMLKVAGVVIAVAVVVQLCMLLSR
jgi:hypothetical protein